MASSVTQGALTPWSATGNYNSILFAIRNALGAVNTVALVQVQSCTNNGGVSPIGQVSVLPLVNQLDGSGKGWPHATVFNLPYLRIQAGSSGVICDPSPNDVGVAVFCSRDISSVKANNGAQSNPGSGRRFSMSDGIYLGAVISASAPSQYLQLNSSGVSLVSPEAATVTAPSIKLSASGATPQTLMNDTFLQWFQSTVMPFLAGLGFTGTVPSGSATVNTEAS